MKRGEMKSSIQSSQKSQEYINYELPKIKKVYDDFTHGITDTNKDISLEDIQSTYLGKDGKVTQLLHSIKDQPSTKRAQFGKEVNLLKKYVTEQIKQFKQAQAKKYAESKVRQIDVTAPFDENTPLDKRPKLERGAGHKHPLLSEMEYISNIFNSMGFEVVESRQLDDEYHMFSSLNFPEGHPARDMWDTFWTDEGLTPPAHTSTMQNRLLKRGELPIRAVVYGRVFRNESTDASHEHTLHQLEGLYVDRNISFANMIGALHTFLEAYYETKLEYKMQSCYFPFTEPSAEVAISCPFCQKMGCPTCGGTGWIELLGCGMVHPNVLTEGGVDPKKYSGFAWGIGLDRLVMIKNRIEEVRKFHSGKLSFLEQF